MLFIRVNLVRLYSVKCWYKETVYFSTHALAIEDTVSAMESLTGTAMLVMRNHHYIPE